MKYPTLRALKEALDSGELKLAEDEKLVIDNDETHLYVRTGPGDMDYEQVFGVMPYELTEQALDLLGIPHEDA